MTTVELVQLRRAAEQIETERVGGYHERDSWDVQHIRLPPEPRARPCLAGDCLMPVKRHGYCGPHWWRVSRSGARLDIEGLSSLYRGTDRSRSRRNAR